MKFERDKKYLNRAGDVMTVVAIIPDHERPLIVSGIKDSVMVLRADGRVHSPNTGEEHPHDLVSESVGPMSMDYLAALEERYTVERDNSQGADAVRDLLAEVRRLRAEVVELSEDHAKRLRGIRWRLGQAIDEAKE